MLAARSFPCAACLSMFASEPAARASTPRRSLQRVGIPSGPQRAQRTGIASLLPLSSGVSLSETPGLDSDKPSRNGRRLTLCVVRLRQLAIVERLVERLLVDAGLAGDLAQRPARARGLLG